MADPQHIIVGIDFSHCSANALKEALRVAESPRMVIALHVIDEWAFSRVNWGNKLNKEAPFYLFQKQTRQADITDVARAKEEASSSRSTKRQKRS